VCFGNRRIGVKLAVGAAIVERLMAVVGVDHDNVKCLEFG